MSCHGLSTVRRSAIRGRSLETCALLSISSATVQIHGATCNHDSGKPVSPSPKRRTSVGGASSHGCPTSRSCDVRSWHLHRRPSGLQGKPCCSWLAHWPLNDVDDAREAPGHLPALGVSSLTCPASANWKWLELSRSRDQRGGPASAPACRWRCGRMLRYQGCGTGEWRAAQRWHAGVMTCREAVRLIRSGNL